MPARARTIDIAAVVDGLRAELGTGERAAWMIDPGAACLYALNAKATSLYPQASKGDTGVTVDSAMPAIVTLRRLMRTPKRHRSQDRPQWLLFWTNRGQKRVLCDIRIVATDSGIFYKMLSQAQIDWLLQQPHWDRGEFGWGRVGAEHAKDWRRAFCDACFEFGRQRPEECNLVYAVAGR